MLGAVRGTSRLCQEGHDRFPLFPIRKPIANNRYIVHFTQDVKAIKRSRSTEIRFCWFVSFYVCNVGQSGASCGSLTPTKSPNSEQEHTQRTLKWHSPVVTPGRTEEKPSVSCRSASLLFSYISCQTGATRRTARKGTHLHLFIFLQQPMKTWNAGMP